LWSLMETNFSTNTMKKATLVGLREIMTHVLKFMNNKMERKGRYEGAPHVSPNSKGNNPLAMGQGLMGGGVDASQEGEQGWIRG
jgi:hypothetical protein